MQRSEVIPYFARLEEAWAEILNLPQDMVWTPHSIGLSAAMRGRDNWDNLIIFDGEKGTSKTTAAGETGYFQQQYGPEVPDDYVLQFQKIFEENFIYSCPVKQLVPKIFYKYSYLPKYSSIVCDEVKDLHKRGFASYFNMEMAKFVGKNRKWQNPDTGEDVGNKTLIMCLDNVMALEREVRNSANVYVHMITRGIGVIFRPVKLAFISDPFFSDRFEKLLLRVINEKNRHKGITNLLGIKAQLDLYSEMPTYDGIFVFPSFDLYGTAGKFTVDPNGAGPVEKKYLELEGKSKIAQDINPVLNKSEAGHKSDIIAGKLINYLRSNDKTMTFEGIKSLLKDTDFEVSKTHLQRIEALFKESIKKPVPLNRD